MTTQPPTRTNQPVILITEPLAPQPLHWLSERAQIIHCSSDDPGFTAHLSLADGLIVRTYTTVNETLLSKAPKLRVVGRAGVGIDNIDLHACKNHDITVVYTPDANTDAVVEFIFAHLFDHFRPRNPVTQALNLATWQQQRNAGVAQHELNELTLGILGLGRIGCRLAEVARSFHMKTIHHDLINISPEQRFGSNPVPLDDLLHHADILTIHIDGRASNQHFINHQIFSRMNTRIFFINASRGMVVDPRAAADFFTNHPDAAAVFDVHEPEPIPENHPLLGLPNVKLTPHIAGRTKRGLRRMSEVVYDVYAALTGNTPKYPAPPQ